MSLAIVHSRAQVGVEAPAVTVDALLANGRPDLAELIRAIDAIRTADGVPAIPRLRFVTSHPWDLSERLIAAMAECPSVCEHLHLPVQSGDDAVLRRMGRQYTVDSYLDLVAKLRDALRETGLPAENSTGPGTPMPTPHRRPGTSLAAASSRSNSASTRSRHASGPSSMRAGSS